MMQMTTVGAIGLTVGMLCFIVAMQGFNIRQSIDNLTKEVKRLNDTNDKHNQPVCEEQLRCDNSGVMHGVPRMVRLESKDGELAWIEYRE